MSEKQATLFEGAKPGIRIAINQVEYTVSGTGPIVHIFGREPDGRAVHLQVTGVRPYFYAPVDEVAEMVAKKTLPSQVTAVDDPLYHSIKGEDLKRLYTFRPTDVRDIRDLYSHHFEADIPFATRYMIDASLTGGVEAPAEIADQTEVSPVEVEAPARLCFIDIECEDVRGFPEPGRDAIICITAWDSFDDAYSTFLYASPGTSPSFSEEWTAKNGCLWKGKSRHTVCSYATEVEMLKAFVAYIREKDPDILSGWNFTDFDFPYITGRMQALRLNPADLSRLPGMTERAAVRGRALFDLLTAYKKLQPSQKESYRLDAIAEEEVGERKVRYTGTVSGLWADDPEKLVEYNCTDVELCVRINEKNNIVDFYRMIARYVGVPLDRTLNSSNVIDIYILRKAHGKFVLPSKGNVVADEFEGATVFEPSLGVKENVVVLDLKSLYPMAMMTINASPETKDPSGELTAPNGIRFRKNPDGLTRSILAELMAERDSLKKRRNEHPYGSPGYTLLDLQQGVIKVIMNTYYGVSGYSRFRLYDREIGAAVTSVGRAIIGHTRQVITGMGYSVLYGDTDSCMVELPNAPLEETIAMARAIEARLNESYSVFARETLHADRHYFSIKFEKIYARFFQAGKKKRYAGHLVWKEGVEADKIDIVGFEMRRSDSPQITREVQEQILSLILKGAPLSEVKAFLGNVIRTYRRGGYSLDEVGIPGGIGKALEEYEIKDAHIRGAVYSNTYLGTDFKRGSKPKRIYIRSVTAKYPQTDVMDFEYADQVPPEFVVDWETMLEKTIKQPIERIIEPLGWTWTDVDPSRTTLFDFA